VGIISGFVSYRCKKGFSGVVKYLLTPISEASMTRLMITSVAKMFKPVLTKPALRNLILTTIAIALAQTFCLNEIAFRLPVAVKT
jgi:hypothetical protein